jgi:beta-mannanase
MLIGLHLDGVPQEGIGPLRDAEAVTGRIDLVHWFQAWGGGHRAFRPDWLDEVARSGRAGMITWEPWVPGGDPSQPALAPSAIAAGDHDRYLKAWAEGFARRHDELWYLRPMHEMNGTWYPWGGGDPSLFQSAWVHIHELFRVAGASSVAWVWCPLVDDVAGPFEAYYPGSDYVDVLALDGYNWGAEVPQYGGWRDPAQVFADAYDRLVALGRRPIWLAEVGCAPEGGDKPAWLAELLRLAATRFDRLETVAFFSLDKERDWRVHHDPTVGAAIRGRAQPGA